jgi:hypothetical protein
MLGEPTSADVHELVKMRGRLDTHAFSRDSHIA